MTGAIGPQSCFRGDGAVSNINPTAFEVWLRACRDDLGWTCILPHVGLAGSGISNIGRLRSNDLHILGKASRCLAAHSNYIHHNGTATFALKIHRRMSYVVNHEMIDGPDATIAFVMRVKIE